MDKRQWRSLGRRLTVRYVLIHAMFWMSYASLWGFAAVFLPDKGFSSREIGLVTAAGSICAVILQPYMASLAEKKKRLTARRLGMACALIAFAGAALLIPAQGTAVVALLFLVTASVTASNSALLNAVGMEYVNMGVPLKYELARGCGSAAFACGALIYGRAAEAAGAECLMLFCLGESAVLFFLLAGLPDRKKLGEAYGVEIPQAGSEKAKGSFLSVLAGQKRLLILFAGIVLLFVGHNSLNTYLINIVEYLGGGDSQMGAANAAAAVVELPGMLAAGYLLTKISGGSILRFAGVMFFVKSALTLAAGNLSGLMAAQLLQAAAYAFFTPISVYYINAVVPAPYRVSGQAALGIATMGLGASLGNLSGGLILDAASVPAMLLFCTGCSGLGALTLYIGIGGGKGQKRGE